VDQDIFYIVKYNTYSIAKILLKSSVMYLILAPINTLNFHRVNIFALKITSKIGV